MTVFQRVYQFLRDKSMKFDFSFFIFASDFTFFFSRFVCRIFEKNIVSFLTTDLKINQSCQDFEENRYYQENNTFTVKAYKL